MKFLGFFVVCLTAVSGFVAPSTPRLSTAVRPATAAAPMRMGLKDDVQKAAATASVAVLTAAPALATEGTGEVRGLPNESCCRMAFGRRSVLSCSEEREKRVCVRP